MSPLIPITPTPSDQPTGRDQSLIISPTGEGKTTFAVTASSQCPAHLTAKIGPPPPATPVTTIEDMAWIGYDRNALAGFANLRLAVPLYYDLSKVPPAEIMEQSLATIADIKQRGVPRLVFDTATVFDIQLQLRHKAKAQTNKMAYFDAILADWSTIYSALRQLDVELQFLAHMKAAFDADDTSKVRRQALGIPDYAAQITGQALGRIRADCDHILPVRRKMVVEAGKRVQYAMVQTQPTGGVESKVRGGSGLPDELYADWRVLRAALGGAE